MGVVSGPLSGRRHLTQGALLVKKILALATGASLTAAALGGAALTASPASAASGGGCTAAVQSGFRLVSCISAQGFDAIPDYYLTAIGNTGWDCKVYIETVTNYGEVEGQTFYPCRLGDHRYGYAFAGFGVSVRTVAWVEVNYVTVVSPTPSPWLNL
jgi:hypothetical protein